LDIYLFFSFSASPYIWRDFVITFFVFVRVLTAYVHQMIRIFLLAIDLNLFKCSYAFETRVSFHTFLEEKYHWIRVLSLSIILYIF
jgi:hypothetical protein